MSNPNTATPACTKQIEHLFWPPKHLLPATAGEGDRIDLLAYLDAEVYNTRGSYPLKLPYGVTVLRDRVVLEQERFSSPSRDHQTALASQFQAAFAEQGFAVVVKEWANPTQKRSILRVRLKCRFAGCKFHFQINWDQNMGYWFISRRRCGIFQHSCRNNNCPEGSSPVDTVLNNNNKRPVSSDSPPPVFAPPNNKRARVEAPQRPVEQEPPQQPQQQQPYLITPQISGNHALAFRTVSCEASPAQAEQTKSVAKANDNTIDFAESLLELSKGKSGSQQEDETEPQDQPAQPQQQREPAAKDNQDDQQREQAQQQLQVNSAPVIHSNVRTRPIVLGEIPHGTQAFAQMATTMGPNLFTHLVHGRGEMTLTMSFDGEGFVLRTNVPSVPPSLPHPPMQQQPQQPPPPQQQPQQQRRPMDPEAARMAPLNYPYLPPRRFPPGSRNDPAVVML